MSSQVKNLKKLLKNIKAEEHEDVGLFALKLHVYMAVQHYLLGAVVRANDLTEDRYQAGRKTRRQTRRDVLDGVFYMMQMADKDYETKKKVPRLIDISLKEVLKKKSYKGLKISSLHDNTYWLGDGGAGIIEVDLRRCTITGKDTNTNYYFYKAIFASLDSLNIAITTAKKWNSKDRLHGRGW